MIFKVMMKTPDALDFFLCPGFSELGEEKEAELEKFMNLCKRWFNHETVTLVIDTEKETCTVEEV
jgi:hypothetical protein